AVAREMAAAVNANEEGCLSYKIFHGETPKNSSLSNAARTWPQRKLTAILSISKQSAPAWLLLGRTARSGSIERGIGRKAAVRE
ncbi:MAG: hypothetical protein MK125_13485, partial [Dehalococcoidia bacterium]|nr:hypothetical protein [Dehalococcoidia bacterium]